MVIKLLVFVVSIRHKIIYFRKEKKKRKVSLAFLLVLYFSVNQLINSSDFFFFTWYKNTPVTSKKNVLRDTIYYTITGGHRGNKWCYRPTATISVPVMPEACSEIRKGCRVV